MASHKFEKEEKEWLLMRDWWMFCQKYWVLEDNEEYWKSMTKDAEALMKKYNFPFADKIINAFIDTKLQEWKEKGNG